MDTLPNELVEAIINTIPDTTSLKACALVVSSFREPSQRILLRSMTFTTRNRDELLRLLSESPHLASYTRRLIVELELLPGLDAVEFLKQLRGKLTNVSQLLFCGGTEDAHWDDIAPEIIGNLLNFVEDQPLQGLHIMELPRLPTYFLPRLLSAASTVSFLFGSMNTDSALQAPLASGPVAIVPVMENLLLGHNFRRLGELSLTPDFAPYMAKLRRLWVRPDAGYSSSMIFAAANTLEEICFDCMDWMDNGGFTTPPLPTIPHLRFAAFRLRFHQRDAPWFVDTMCTLLASSAEEIIVTYQGNPFTDSEEETTIALSPATMDALDCVLRDRPAFPRIRWRVFVESIVQDFKTSLQRGMPDAYATGKLSVIYTDPHIRGLVWADGGVIVPA
ncbi:hypothetical protein C8R43DRAFT_991230 [Mycena crocata]|nr:hypothetical protein C8R43DRAFT_991230 [Mycena crocata]